MLFDGGSGSGYQARILTFHCLWCWNSKSYTVHTGTICFYHIFWTSIIFNQQRKKQALPDITSLCNDKILSEVIQVDYIFNILLSIANKWCIFFRSQNCLHDTSNGEQTNYLHGEKKTQHHDVIIFFKRANSWICICVCGKMFWVWTVFRKNRTDMICSVSQSHVLTFNTKTKSRSKPSKNLMNHVFSTRFLLLFIKLLYLHSNNILSHFSDSFFVVL